MASRYSITTEGLEAGSTSASETLLLLKGAAAVKVEIVEWSASFDGITAAAVPINVSIKRGSSTAAGTGSAATEEKWDPDNPTANCVGLHSYSAEPTYAGQPLQAVYVHPQGGIYTWQRNGGPGSGIVLDNATSSFIGLQVNTTAAVNTLATVVWDE